MLNCSSRISIRTVREQRVEWENRRSNVELDDISFKGFFDVQIMCVCCFDRSSDRIGRKGI